MVQIIAGRKGKGKTKYLLDKANVAIKESHGSIVYLDKSGKHMYELNNKIRLINVKDYPLESTDAFIGFISGIISQDHDLEQMYLDSFLKLAHLEGKDVTNAVKTLHDIGNQYNITFVISISLDLEEFHEDIRDYVVISL